jgi:hypothetical protein
MLTLLGLYLSACNPSSSTEADKSSSNATGTSPTNNASLKGESDTASTNAGKFQLAAYWSLELGQTSCTCEVKVKNVTKAEKIHDVWVKVT